MARGVSLLVLVLAAGVVPAADKFFLRGGERVVFLGDSNTFAGHYVAYVDAWLATRYPDRTFDLINLGLPSETVSGLSEPDHPYPRPDVHERLERVLARTKPDVVVACYGMNDGIYYPFAEERLKKYQEGVRRLVERVQKAGARVVLMTPPPFDPRPLRGKTLPASAEKYSWVHPYEGYDDVLRRYSDWLLTLREKGFEVVDAHAAVSRYVAAVRAVDPDYRVAGDGIHGSPSGHWPIAEALLRAWGASEEADGVAIDVARKKATRGEVSKLAVEDGGVSFTWRSKLPMPADPRWDARLYEKGSAGERLSRYRLTVTGLSRERYELFEGDRLLGKMSKEGLAAGVDLLRFHELSTNRRSAELWKLVEQRQRLLGLAWLTDVGHKRPDTPKGLPLDEAQKQAAPLAEKVRKLAEQVEVPLRVVPAGN
jgi:lysophospholipase L1-like esterase